jgi:hypothetical protein
MNSSQLDGMKPPKWSLWGWLGFGLTHTQRPENDDAQYMITNVFFHLDWKDRLKIALSGKAHVQIVIETDACVRRASSRASVRALPPFWKEGQ